METTFTELRNKEVINVLSGRQLGNICDIVINLQKNCIQGFVVPGSKNIFSIFKPPQEIFIPFNNICKIGEDVILVEVVENRVKKNNNKNIRVFDAGETENLEKNN